MRRLAFILFFFAAIWMLSAAGETNYFCVVCGKGPLTGHFWMTKWGALCDDCYHLKDHCSICGLPIKDGDGHIQTADGRLICKFDKPNVVLDVDAAKELFADTRRDVVEMYGQGFALQYPGVAVTMFDVDYWSEKNGANGLHKFGFASTRKTSDGVCTHEVVMLSGRLREEMMGVAAHEYTHLWINENRPADRVIDGDTIEAICELTAYNLMGEKNMPEMQKRILENPYTEGSIKTLVAVYQEHGIAYIFNWIKNGTAENFDGGAQVVAASQVSFNAAPPELPEKIKFTGLLVIGPDRRAVINGMAFAVGDQKNIKLKDKMVMIRCREIRDGAVVLELDGGLGVVTLKAGEEISPP